MSDDSDENESEDDDEEEEETELMTEEGKQNPASSVSDESIPYYLDDSYVQSYEQPNYLDPLYGLSKPSQQFQ